MPEGTDLSAGITVLAIAFYFVTIINVGRMRQRHGIKAPAVTGNAEFERAYRVQMNTLESMPMFLPLLWLATLYLGGWMPAALGLLWIVGRILYMHNYMKAPDKRGPGFVIQMLAQVGLLLLTVWGIAT